MSSFPRIALFKLAVNLVNFTDSIRQQLSPESKHLDLATNRYLVGLKDFLASLLQTYIRHPDDVELNRDNAVRAIRQIQGSMQTLQTYVRAVHNIVHMFEKGLSD